MKRRIEIGGQDFDVCERFTLEQELYLAGLIRRGALDRIPFQPHDSYDEVVQRLLAATENSHVGRQLIAALIVPAGEPWTTEEALRTIAHLKEWKGTLDDNAADMLCVVVYQALFERGVLRSGRDAARGKEGAP